jgi:hypothetical protein
MEGLGMNRHLRQGLLLPLAFFFTVEAFAQETEEVYWGEARDEKERLLYTEKHITHYVDGETKRSLTLYQDSSGREIASLESDYTRSLAMPTYVFKDFKRGYEEGLRYRDGRYYVFNRDDEGGEKEKPLEDPENVFSCQGWHYYIVEHLDAIQRGDVFTISLIFPNKLRTYDFKIEKVDAEGELLRVKVRFANWLVSWFVPHLDLVYDQKRRKLVEYRGVSNIFDAKGDLQEVRITYSDDNPAG